MSGAEIVGLGSEFRPAASRAGIERNRLKAELRAKIPARVRQEEVRPVWLFFGSRFTEIAGARVCRQNAAVMTVLRAVVLSAALSATICLAQQDVGERASRLELRGEFKQAAAILQSALDDSSHSQAVRKQLAFELDRLERIKKDFSHTREGLFEDLKKSVRDLTREEFEQWIAEGRFDSRNIDGRRYFMGSSVSNLYFRYPELNSRRIKPKDTAEYERALWGNSIAVRKAAKEANTPYVLPHRFHVTMIVTAKADAATAGETIRAWLPVPRDYPHQSDFELLKSSPPVKHLAPESSPIRSVYLEQTAPAAQPTVFQIEYNYTARAVRFDLQPEKIRPIQADDPELAPFLGEAPHVVFTDRIKELSDSLVAGETNALVKARKFYDWISDRIKYSYAIEYSTIRNISDYCLTNGFGDCGQEALLFITLCRYNGIPARWQSGWYTFPGHKTIHDWAEIYLAPCGWVPVDPYMGIFATRYATHLTGEQRKELRDFYFGGLDQYRLAANSDHSQPLDPPKVSFRSDDVDFQRGELETDGQNIYFDQFNYSLVWRKTD